ncbi:hypothetical protein PR048_030619 [Dryococelus australis]|uniref:DNA helicase Pif1-like 2B domain-containing protein n=1 Tax=Dryococelus australis TaxID=614101 RepID=A0ABQ9G9W9_9NEOP|nr:hypothetical protein PR048_030619 [Dryococelus australis]
MRQQGNASFVDILNALRIGELQSEHFVELISKVNTSRVATGEFSIEKALRIYPTNQQVNDHNQAVLEHFRAKGTTMFKIKAQAKLIDATRNGKHIDIDTIIPSDINKTGGMPQKQEITVGAKVMLRSNIDVGKGLVNGAIGHITEIIWPCFRRAPIYETDIPSVRVDFANKGIHIIHPKSVFPAKFSYGTAKRRMLQMVLSWAFTVHKMQGSTVDYAVIYLGQKLFAAGQAYVALSRVKSLEGLPIEESDYAKLSGEKPCNTEALLEMNTMRNHPITYD